MATPLSSASLSVVIDSSTLLCPDTFNFTGNADLIEITCLGASGWKRSRPDLKSWTASISGTVHETVGHTGIGIEELFSKFTLGASVGIYYLPDISSNFYLSGGGYLSSVSIDAAAGSAVTYSADITGDDALSAAFTS